MPKNFPGINNLLYQEVASLQYLKKEVGIGWD